MFGSYRYVLAYMVMLIHVWPELQTASGVYAVFAFYVLSGYLMALILDQTYGPTRDGIRRYFANRALRIYPPYVAALVLAAVVALIDAQTARVIGSVRIPHGGVEWLRNLFIFSLHLDRAETARLVTLAWSLDIELCFYVAMGLGLSRTRFRVAMWFGASLAYTAYLVWAGYAFDPRYSVVPAASLPYATGALIYHFRDASSRWLSHRGHVPLSLGLYFATTAFPNAIWGGVFVKGFYASLAFAAYVVAALGAVDRKKAPSWFRRLDARLGDLAYPIFLCHTIVAAGLVMAGVATERGPLLFFASIPVVNVVAWLVHRFTQQDIDDLRDRVRGSARARTDA